MFDLDDTLFPESQFVLSGFRAVADHAAAKHSLLGFYEPAAELFAAGRRGNIFDAVLNGLGVPATPELVKEFVAVYRDHLPRIQLFPDVLPVFEALKPSGQLAILTDGYHATQRNKVTALGLAERVAQVVYSDALGREHWKPHGLPYQKVMEGAGCSGGECVYVGDNPLKDFVTARKLGWLTVRIRRPGGEHAAANPPAPDHDADHTVTTLAGLAPLVTG